MSKDLCADLVSIPGGKHQQDIAGFQMEFKYCVVSSRLAM